jgi:hypothetical protein
MRWFNLLLMCAGLLGTGSNLDAATNRIIKVLPHFLDLHGRQSLSPSLYERDAYQARLRANSDQRSALQFDVQWKAKVKDSTRLKLRLEARGSKSHVIEPLVVEKSTLPKGWFSNWSAIKLDNTTYEQLGDIVSWRISLWEGDRLLAEEKSFLW